MTYFTTRRDDAELNVYFGGRAAFLKAMQEELTAAEEQLAAFDAGVLPAGDPDFCPDFVQTPAEERQSMQHRVDGCRAAIAINA